MTHASMERRDAEGALRKVPTVREVESMSGALIATMHNRTLTLRPKGRRVGGRTEVEVLWGAIYLRAMADRVNEERRARARARRSR